MTYLFGFNNSILKSELQIACFKNKDKNLNKHRNLKLFKCYPQNGKWKISIIDNNKKNDYFYILDHHEISNKDIFFLSERNTLDNFNDANLEKPITDETMERANFKILLETGGFSSYQADYPFNLATKNGSIISSVSSLMDNNADKNYILFRNIFCKPIEDKFKAYLVDYKNKIILEEYELKTNNSNFIEIEKKNIKDGFFFVTQKYLGIPMYVSIKNNFLSFEHTHPYNTYLFGKNQYTVLSNLKKEINEIIYKKNSQ
jgi:hypothetical protein